METKWLLDFLSLVDTGNFSRSADARATTQPAFSRRIKALEQWMGATLFDRSKQPIGLTSAGVRFHPVAEQVLRRLLQSRDEIRQIARNTVNTLSFAATHSLSLVFFPDWIRGFEQVEGVLRIRLDSHQIATCVQLLQRGACNFMLAPTHATVESALPEIGFASVTVGHDRLLPVSAPDDEGRPRFVLPGAAEAFWRRLCDAKATSSQTQAALVRLAPPSILPSECSRSPRMSQPSHVAILGLMLESNSFAPVITAEDFHSRVYLAGDAILADLRSADPSLPTEIRGFFQRMDADCDWTPVPILLGLVEAGGPMDHGFFTQTLEEMRRRLQAAMPLEAVYVCNHGAMTTTEDKDPDGTIFAMVRSVVGPEVPVVATLDLHGNVSEKMVEAADAIVAYRTNPHVDMLERGAEVAVLLLDLLSGMEPEVAFLRLPITPPTVTLLTESGPYADLIDLGQSMRHEGIANVSILGGFAYADTPKNGLAIIVTGRQRDGSARRLAERLAQSAWADHRRYAPVLTSMEEAVARVKAVCSTPGWPPVILADVADNPGGGGNGNTMWIIEALFEAGCQGVIAGIINEPRLAAEATRLGVGATFQAVFNDTPPDKFSLRFAAPARVLRLHDGKCVGRRGFYAGRRMTLGASALLDLGGIEVVVISKRTQCADPVFLEMMGCDISVARAVVVKSRGHFRAGFDEFFDPEQVIEVDTPGLTSPILSRFDFRHLPRPVFPVDAEVSWQLPG